MQTRYADTQQELHNRLVSLQELHSQLAREIELKEGRSDIDDLALHRLKKEKLLAKDKIIMLQSQLQPDKRA
ncbi:YdcH family protein [Burkholderia alba]|uniref:YdcH family protein n=1 Tax=Burkholderia alba TaxID=2683677 RepID=UPI002B05ADF7|nr:YdcH family protein [Burkholderia alba]